MTSPNSITFNDGLTVEVGQHIRFSLADGRVATGTVLSVDYAPVSSGIMVQPDPDQVFGEKDQRLLRQGVWHFEIVRDNLLCYSLSAGGFEWWPQGWSPPYGGVISVAYALKMAKMWLQEYPGSPDRVVRILDPFGQVVVEVTL